jgi:hypothetical protein
MTDITDAQKKALLKLEGFKEIRDQFTKEQKMAGGGKKRMRGGGFWDSVSNWFKSAGTSINDFLKRTKLISNVAGAVLPVLAPLGTAILTANPLAAAASVGAARAAAQGISSLGYGSKMRVIGRGLTRQSNGLIVNQKGGDARLSIVPPEMRLQGRGLTRQYNGLIVNQKGGRMMRGRGAGTEYGTVSSAFGEIVM